MKSSGGLLAGVGATAVVVAAVVGGLVVLGSPAEQRTRRGDEQRVADLRAIKAATDLYWTRHARLPASLDALAAEPGVTIRAADPLTAEGYPFRAVDSVRYEVCARFVGATPAMSGDPEQDLWAHGPGEQCFTLEAEDVADDARR